MEIIKDIAKTLYERTYAKSHIKISWNEIPIEVTEYWYGQAIKASHLYIEWTYNSMLALKSCPLGEKIVLQPLPLGKNQG